MKGGALVLLMQLLVVMILSFPCANAHMSVDIAGEEAAHQRLLWLTSTAQSISGQMEQLLGGDGQGISSLATLRGMGEWMYSRIWSQVGADVEEVPGSVPPPMRSREDRSLLEQHFTSSTLEVPLKAVASQTSADVGPSTQFRCNGGSFAVLNNAQFQCPWSGTLAPQQMAWIPYSQRVGCTRVGGQSSTYSPESWGQMCVCTPDYVPMIKKGTVDCFPRPLSVSVELDPQYRCRREEDLGATDIPPYYPNDYCLVAERKGIVQFTVKLRSSWMLDDELRGVMDESKGVAVLPSPLASSTEEWVTSATVDTYAGIARSVTWYIVYPTVVGDGFSFCISQNNYLFSYINKFSTVFSFTEPEVMDSTTKLDALTSPYSNLFHDLFGGKDGTAATGGYTVSYDLSSVPDACLEGGAMYMETGLQSVQQLFMGYAVARIHISFPNLSKPSDKTFSYKVGLSSAYIFLIVCACLIVMGAVLALGRRLYRRNQQQRAQAKSDALTKTAE